MIYTVTFNPAIDYIVRMPEFIAGATNRVNYEQVLGGGKGINVSIVLKNLGIDSTALGFISGFTGKEIIRQLHSFGCKSDFIELPNGFSRINVKIKTNDEETEVNGQGPDIPANAIEELFAKLDKLTAGDTLVLAGSIPKTLPDDIYEKIMARLENRNINIVVDATKKTALKHCQEAYVLADSTKFDQITPITFANLEDAIIITDILKDKKYLDYTNIMEVL